MALAYGTGLVGRGVSVVAPLVVIPLLLPALGEENFGVWATVTSFTSMLVFADLGLGSGLLTALSRSFGGGDLARGRKVVSDTYAAITVVAAVGAALSLALIALVDVSAWLGVEGSNADAAEGIVAVVACGFFVTMPLSLIVRVQLGVQQAWQTNVWAAAGPMVSIPLVWYLASHEARPALVVAGAVAGPIVVAIANNLTFFLGSRVGRSLAPDLRLVDRKGVRELLALGTAFAGVSILSNVALNIDNILIAVVLSSAEVTAFAIAARLFRAVALLVSIIGMPLWGANGEAMAKGDFDWVRRTTVRTALGLSAVVAVATGLAVVFREPLIGTWVGSGVDTPIALYAGFACWSVLVAFTTPFFAVQNAAGLLRVQAVGWGAYLVLSVGAKLAVLPVAGSTGVVWVTAICYALTVTPSAVYGCRKVLRDGQPASAVPRGPDA